MNIFSTKIIQSVVLSGIGSIEITCVVWDKTHGCTALIVFWGLAARLFYTLNISVTWEPQ